MFDFINWPIIGRLIKESHEQYGEEMAYGLMRRGWSAKKILEHSQRETVQASCSGDLARAHEGIGMGRAASKAIED